MKLGLDEKRARRLDRLGLLEEPMGYVDGANVYEYVTSNPLALLDPFGLAATDAGATDVDDANLLKGGTPGETDWVREGHIHVTIKCTNPPRCKWIVSSVSDGYVVGSRIATVDLLIRKAGLDPKNIKDADRLKFAKFRANIEKYEGNLRKALVGAWNQVAKEETEVISKLEADSKDALTKKVQDGINNWLDDFGLSAAGVYRADADARGYKPPTKEFLRGRLDAKIDIQITEEGATTRPSK